MKRMFVTTLVLLFAAIPLQADDKKKDDAKSDQKQILGKWKRVELHRDGKVRKEFDRELVLTISKGEITIKFGDRDIKGKFKLDASKKPKQLDITFKREGQTQTRKSIYTLNGDNLKICGPRRAGERPKKFEAKEGDNQSISVYKRVKEKDK